MKNAIESFVETTFFIPSGQKISPEALKRSFGRPKEIICSLQSITLQKLNDIPAAPSYPKPERHDSNTDSKGAKRNDPDKSPCPDHIEIEN